MSQFIDSIREVKRNWKTYDAWEQNQADDASQRKYLSDKLDLPADKVALTREKTKIVLRASDMLDKRSENNCEDAERTTGYIALAVGLPLAALPLMTMKKSKPMPKGQIFSKIDIISLVGTVVLGVGIALWGNEKQKEASRIGRFQAKQHELKDIKNFVIYTPEQIEAAKIVAKSLPDKKDNKSWTKVFAEMKQMSRDKAAYKEWLKDKVKNDDELQKVLNTSFTPEQIKQGQEDKEIITNIVKDINIKAEEYSENMENAYDTMGTLSFLADIPLAYGLNKLLKKVSKNPSALTPVISVAVPIIVSLAILMQGTTQQKKAAQVGRFKKSQEILDNPEVLMNYTDEQMKQAQHIKSSKKKEGFFEGIISDFKFFKTYIKDQQEYDNHVKTKGKEDEKLLEALKHTSVSLKQMKDAKFLQEKTFMTFDKIDEMSQRYSEDTEAGTEIAKQSFGLGWSVIYLGVPAVLGYMGTKGKLPIHKIFKWASDISLNKQSSVRELITKANDIITSDKKLKQEFCKRIFSKNPNSIFGIKELQPATVELAAKVLHKFPEVEKAENPVLAINEIVKRHFRQDKISKWFRNLTADIGKLWFRKVAIRNSADGKLPEKLVPLLGMKYKNYKTFFNTLIAGFVPAMALLLGVPAAFNSWLNNIQKKAGKIGIMKAMNDLDNHQLYVNNENNK